MQDDIKLILSKINSTGYKCYLVGGYVRDLYLLNSYNKDVDIATNCPPYTLKELFSEYDPVEFKYGTIMFKYGVYDIDIAQFRDEQFDGKSTSITFTDGIEIDAKRRDFTINSVYLDKHNNVIDYFGGVSDIKNKKIKFIGNCLNKITEDPSRIYRYLYFILKYHLTFDNDEFEVLCANAKRILDSYDNQILVSKYKAKIKKLNISDSELDLIKRMSIEI